MDKTRKLEQRWYRYRIKKAGSSLLLFLLFPLFIFGGYFIGLNFDTLENIFFPKEVTSNIKIAEVPPKEVEKNITTITALQEPLPLVIEKREEMALEPIIPIIDMDREKIKRTKSVSSYHKKSVSATVRARPNSYLTAQDLSKVKAHPRDTTRLKKIDIHSSSKNYIETMEKKFLKNKQPREALLLAEAFYRKGIYKKSEEWALRANKIDSNLDESWIIFAQSKAKMGKREEAIKILLAYYNKSKSAKVKRAIENIKSRKL